MIAPQGKKNGSAGARKRRKASVIKIRKTNPGFNTPDPNYQFIGTWSKLSTPTKSAVHWARIS